MVPLVGAAHIDMPQPRPSRAAILDAITAHLRRELDAIAAMTRLAADEATNEESKAENKYDTRSLEASYLARGQAERVGALRAAVSGVASIPRDLPGADRPVGVGSIVELHDEDGDDRLVALIPTGGGAKVTVDGHSVLVVTPQSPIGRALLGAADGDEVMVTAAGGPRAYEVSWVG